MIRRGCCAFALISVALVASSCSMSLSYRLSQAEVLSLDPQTCSDAMDLLEDITPSSYGDEEMLKRKQHEVATGCAVRELQRRHFDAADEFSARGLRWFPDDTKLRAVAESVGLLRVFREAVDERDCARAQRAYAMLSTYSAVVGSLRGEDGLRQQLCGRVRERHPTPYVPEVPAELPTSTATEGPVLRSSPTDTPPPVSTPTPTITPTPSSTPTRPEDDVPRQVQALAASGTCRPLPEFDISPLQPGPPRLRVGNAGSFRLRVLITGPENRVFLLGMGEWRPLVDLPPGTYGIAIESDEGPDRVCYFDQRRLESGTAYGLIIRLKSY